MQKGTLVPGPSGNTNIVYWPSQISPRVMWICLSFRLNLNCGRSGKSAILLFVGFLKIKNSPTSLSLIFENSLPKGFSWKNMKKSVISVLKWILDIYSPLVLSNWKEEVWKNQGFEFRASKIRASNLQPQFKNELFHIYFTSHTYLWCGTFVANIEHCLQTRYVNLHMKIST